MQANPSHHIHRQYMRLMQFDLQLRCLEPEALAQRVAGAGLVEGGEIYHATAE
jgi:hypothetical protein